MTHPHSTLTPVPPPPSPHNHPQALIRMWRTLHRTRSGASVCYALVYPRGRMAGGQDLAGHCTTLSSPHGSLLWTFTGWQGSGKLSQKAYSGGSHTEYIRFECCCCFFFSPPSAQPAKSGIKGTLSTPSPSRVNLLPNRRHKWPLSLGNSIWCGEILFWLSGFVVGLFRDFYASRAVSAFVIIIIAVPFCKG